MIAAFAASLPRPFRFWSTGRHAAPRSRRKARLEAIDPRDQALLEAFQRWNAPRHLAQQVEAVLGARPTTQTCRAAILLLAAVGDAAKAQILNARYAAYVSAGAR